jgi:WD40 repeat protein
VGKKQRVREFPLDETERLESRSANVAFTAEGKGLAAVGFDLRLWGLETGKDQRLTPRSRRWERRMKSPESRAWNYERFAQQSLALGPDGQTLAAVMNFSHVVVRDTAGAQEPVAITVLFDGFEAVSFTDNGRGLAVVQGSADGTVTLRVWSLLQRPEHLLRPGFPGEGGAAFLPDGNALVTINEGKIKRIDPDTGGTEVLGEGPKGRVHVFVLAASPDGKAFALVSEPDRIEVWDVLARRPRFTFDGLSSGAFQFSPDGTRVVLADTRTDAVKLYDAQTGTEVARVPRPQTGQGLPLGVAFAPDGQTLAVGGTKYPLQLWDLQTGQELRILSQPLIPLRYLPDRDLLLVARPQENGRIFTLWDLRNDRERARLGGSELGLFYALAPDGKALAIMGEAGVVVWDLATGQARLKLPTTEPGVVAFSPDGRFLAVGGVMKGGVLHVWDTRPIEEVVIRPGG